MSVEKATKLRIIVCREGSEKVNLTFPIYTLRHIESIMPDMVLDKLKERNIDLSEILSQVEASGHSAQTIFEMTSFEKSYRVWIE